MGESRKLQKKVTCWESPASAGPRAVLPSCPGTAPCSPLQTRTRRALHSTVSPCTYVTMPSPLVAKVRSDQTDCTHHRSMGCFEWQLKAKGSETTFMQWPRGCFQGGWWEASPELQGVPVSMTDPGSVLSCFQLTAHAVLTKHVFNLHWSSQKEWALTQVWRRSCDNSNRQLCKSHRGVRETRESWNLQKGH